MSVNSWLMQAREVTKKISEFMYIPAEDFNEEQNDQVVAPPEVDVSGAQLVENSGLPDLEIEMSEQNTQTNNESSFLDGIAVETAKKMANSFLSFAKEATVKAAATAEETAKMLQNVVAEKTIIGDLDREREKFDLEDSRNFLRDPPTETDFDFIQMQPIAAILLKEDPNLQKIRYELVPKQLNEKRFWRNYFYRVSLIRQSALSNRLPSDPACSTESDRDGPSQEKNTDNTGGARAKTGAGNQKIYFNEKLEANRKQKVASEEEWEKELVNEFDDYELVCEKTDPNWEEIEKCIDST